MSKAEKSKKKKEIKTRSYHTLDEREKARKYYLLGLNLTEISKLLDGCSVRTLEKWQQAERWAEMRQIENIKVKALELYNSGKSYEEIERLLLISRVTVWRYIKEASETQTAE
jgi:Uncharacterized conserved protein